MDTPIFERDGRHVVPTPLARGPWDRDSCHGGAPAALLAATVDALPSPVPMQGVRLTYDLLRPVPLAPLTLSSEVLRDGKRVQLATAWLCAADGTELMRCRALRLRVGKVDLPAATVVDDEPPLVGPEELPRLEGRDGWADDGFWRAVDVRMVSGALGDPGPGTAWFRVEAPLLDDVTLTPLARAAAAADFGNGIGSPLPMGPYLFVNPDLTVHLDRLPEGDWVALAARSVVQATGNGLTSSTLSDRGGRIGIAAQSLFVADQR
ncbi:thioesterase family protein [Egicoccus halophilus]|uniref:Acyl-CoA thioesterase n=1 Tax=Egicoccus halophilus TaxID=1670830 RepID=A0A8J3A781_9ACTN|nr:thioesterase family protein [Egicoccus halophilus]GGI05184.1 acyl-CoA thioesterase [Egicoccus halophilus]